MKSAFRFGSGKDVEMWRGGEVALALCFFEADSKNKVTALRRRNSFAAIRSKPVCNSLN